MSEIPRVDLVTSFLAEISWAERDYTTEEPALQLELDDTGVGVEPSPSRTADGYTGEEMKLRVKRARLGLISASVILVAGIVFGIGAGVCDRRNPRSPEELIDVSTCFGLGVAAVVLTGVGLIGMIVSGPVLGTRKRRLRGLQ